MRPPSPSTQGSEPISSKPLRPYRRLLVQFNMIRWRPAKRRRCSLLSSRRANCLRRSLRIGPRLPGANPQSFANAFDHSPKTALLRLWTPRGACAFSLPVDLV